MDLDPAQLELLVCAKQIRKIDGDAVEFVDGATEVSPDLLEWNMNEWDAVAAEMALQLREGHGGRVTVCGYGTEDADPALRRCLAMGADRAIRLHGTGRDPLTVARALASLAKSEQPGLVLCGAQSGDEGHAATGTMIAQLLEVPCVALVRSVALDRGLARVVRELEGGIVEEVEVALPAVLTIQTGAQQPRYVNLRALKQADRAEIDIRTPPEGGKPAFRVRRLLVPPAQRETEMIHGDAAAVARRVAEIVKERLA